MKTKILCGLLVLFIAGAKSFGASEDANKEKILALERQWCAAYLHNDADFIKKFEVSDFTLTNSRGEISTVADDLKELADGTVKYDIFENREMKVRLYGDTAVVTGWTKLKGIYQGKPFETDVAFTDTLARINGEWRALAGHASKPPPK